MAPPAPQDKGKSTFLYALNRLRGNIPDARMTGRVAMRLVGHWRDICEGSYPVTFPGDAVVSNSNEARGGNGLRAGRCPSFAPVNASGKGHAGCGGFFYFTFTT